ncbi:MAG: hypothetical protein AVDCRST_MAG93-6574 [uncultured Chloroflexia bacterium]|uniref:YdhG-like domain-containing protein n=1 Tax=uncultured Chloroflexia bacterium TaxID=1672391 RepID=A0A6J4LRH6_9CHLR|nr:MAG: hypothetical protein AVDCRST_MAG93-6574 [uncultured Chloroflexia bacterium]
MKLEKTSGPLRALADRLFAFVEELSGERPQFIASDGWYHALTNEKVFVYLYLVGKTAKKNPRHSVVLATQWDDRLAVGRVTQGNNMFGYPSAELAVRATNPDDIAPAEEFLRRALQLSIERGRR